jgi:hypothetical protein
MFVVAIAELSSPVDAEAAALAVDLATTAYDARLLLAGGLPAVVRTTPDKGLALELLARLRGRGHGAIACDAGAVVASNAMVSMRRFRLGETAIALSGQPGLELPYDDVLALVAAVHRTRVETETHLREKKFSVSRAIMTSGLSMTKAVSTDAHAGTEDREAALYVFRRSGATPWILRENGTDWSGHGRPVAPTRAENFRTAVEAMRARAHGAVFDDRLVTRKARETAALRTGSGSKSVTTSSDGGVDLLAHLLALWIARGGGPLTTRA